MMQPDSPANMPRTPLFAARDRIDVMASKVSLFFYYHNKIVIDFVKFHVLIGGELKKYLEIIFILD